MKKLLVGLSVVAATMVGVAHARSALVDLNAKTVKDLSSTRLSSASKQPICICSFDPETGNWTCIPTGCWLEPKPDVGLIKPYGTSSTLPMPDLPSPPKRW